MTINYDKKTRILAQNLRNNMTPWERKLYYLFLKDLDYKFYRQRTIGKYVADFYCSKLKLIIELDGSQHYGEEYIKYDKNRTEYFNSIGIKVLRYTNLDVDKHFNEVCEDIYKYLNLNN